MKGERGQGPPSLPVNLGELRSFISKYSVMRGELEVRGEGKYQDYD